LIPRSRNIEIPRFAKQKYNYKCCVSKTNVAQNGRQGEGEIEKS
jgi:hypothetical protein